MSPLDTVTMTLSCLIPSRPVTPRELVVQGPLSEWWSPLLVPFPVKEWKDEVRTPESWSDYQYWSELVLQRIALHNISQPRSWMATLTPPRPCPPLLSSSDDKSFYYISDCGKEWKNYKKKKPDIFQHLHIHFLRCVFLISDFTESGHVERELKGHGNHGRAEMRWSSTL